MFVPPPMSPAADQFLIDSALALLLVPPRFCRLSDRPTTAITRLSHDSHHVCGHINTTCIQGDHSGCSLGVVDIKTKVAFLYKEHIHPVPGIRAAVLSC